MYPAVPGQRELEIVLGVTALAGSNPASSAALTSRNAGYHDRPWLAFVLSVSVFVSSVGCGAAADIRLRQGVLACDRTPPRPHQRPVKRRVTVATTIHQRLAAEHDGLDASVASLRCWEAGEPARAVDLRYGRGMSTRHHRDGPRGAGHGAA